MNRIFYRYRYRFSYGTEEWEYDDILEGLCPNWKEFVNEQKEVLCKEYDWSDHYRGIDIEKVDLPPLQWLKEQMEESGRKAKYHLSRESDFRKMIEGDKDEV